MLSAVKTLEWLVKHETRLDEIFGFQISSWTLNLSYIFSHYTPQEIIDRIEEYETKKKKQEFKSGDIIKNTKLSIVSSFKEYVNEDYVRTSGNDVWNIENVVKIERPTWSEYECAHRYDKPKEERNEPTSNSGEFKVGDWVRVKTKSENKDCGIGKIKQIQSKYPEMLIDMKNNVPIWISPDLYVEHAESLTEENEVDKTSDVYHFAEWCYVNGISFGFMSTNENPTPKRLQEIISRYESETGKSKEEKQKIEKLPHFPVTTIEQIDKINELVDAVNELRGAK